MLWTIHFHPKNAEGKREHVRYLNKNLGIYLHKNREITTSEQKETRKFKTKLAAEQFVIGVILLNPKALPEGVLIEPTPQVFGGEEEREALEYAKFCHKHDINFM